jgi:hypothetical protein
MRPLMSWKTVLAIALFEIVFVTGLVVWLFSTLRVDL